jgi:hypothetical protein
MSNVNQSRASGNTCTGTRKETTMLATRQTEKVIVCFDCASVYRGESTNPEHMDKYEERTVYIYGIDTSWTVSIFSARCHVCMESIDFGDAYIATVSDIN